MSNIEKAKNILKSDNGCTLVLVKDEKVYKSNAKGVSPLLGYIDSKTDLQDFSAADKIVGKAAAMLFVLCKVSSVYSPVMSESAVAFLQSKNISYSADVIIKNIINRAGNDICPMEKAVKDTDEPETAYHNIIRTLNKLRSENNGN